jgi:hypothetical protein
MAGIKHQVIQLIQLLPEDVTIDDIMAELYFKLQVDTGLRELDEGRGIPHEEIEQRMSKLPNCLYDRGHLIYQIYVVYY